MKTKPGLYGLKNTNRDFTVKETWGENQFNSSFPAALCCYLASKKMKANYLCISDGIFKPDLIRIEDIFKLGFDDEDLYFAFESQHTPYQKHGTGSLPRTELGCAKKKSTGEGLSGLEVKLTALPGNTADCAKNLHLAFFVSARHYHFGSFKRFVDM